MASRKARTAADVYAHLKGVVILGGAVRSSELSEGIGRSLLDLPLHADERLLDRWIGETAKMAAERSTGRLALKVMLDPGSAEPATRERAEALVELTVARDPLEYRGTGGVIHDVARELADEDYLVIASGAQLLVEPLTSLVDALAARGADVGIFGHRDGTPSGLMLLRCSVLREISDLGYVDLKEQALPSIARKHAVIVEHREAVSFPVRTARDYLGALRQDHRRQRGETPHQDPFAEDCHAEFSVVENGARIGAGARLFDSAVLAGGAVGENAVLVRSIVCGGGIVKAGQRVVDQLVWPGMKRGNSK